MSPAVINATIADLLRTNARLKAEVKTVRESMLRLTVEELGIAQEEAQRLDLHTFLDGYLVGQGSVQLHRKAP